MNQGAQAEVCNTTRDITPQSLHNESDWTWLEAMVYDGKRWDLYCATSKPEGSRWTKFKVMTKDKTRIKRAFTLFWNGNLLMSNTHDYGILTKYHPVFLSRLIDALNQYEVD